MPDTAPPKPTGLIIGAVLEMLLFLGFMLFVGLDHAFLYIGICGVLFGLALLRTAVTPSDPNAAPGVDPDHVRIASMNSLFPKAAIAAAILVAVFSLAVGTQTIHDFARNTLGFDTFMTEPLLRL